MARVFDKKFGYLGDPQLRHALLAAMIEAERLGETVRVKGYNHLRVSPRKDITKDIE